MIRQRTDNQRRVRQAERLARALRILELIQGRGRWNAKDLATELECSVRTVYRDLRALEIAGIPYFEDRAARCYRVRSDFRFPVMNLTEDELVDLGTSAAITSAAGLDVGAGPKPAIRKLADRSSEASAKILSDAEQLISVFGLNLADHSKHLELIRTVQWALLKGRQLLGHYQSPYERSPVRLALSPIRLCLVKQAWYLIARPLGETLPKTYRICRFKTLRMVDARAEVPADFDLKAYFGNAWGVYRGDKSYDVAVEFTPDAAALVVETSWHPSQKVERRPGGRVVLTFTVDGLNEIVHWVLSWSGRAKVIRPAELRSMVLRFLRQAIRLNGGDAKGRSK